MRLNVLRRRAPQAEEDTTLHKGDLYNAMPDHRSLYVSTWVLRLVSLFLSGGAVGAVVVLGDEMWDAQNKFATWALGGPPAGMALVWGIIDVSAILIHDRGFLTRAEREARRKKSKLPATSFCWGPPALHVSVHLTTWLVSLVMCFLLWSRVFSYMENARIYITTVDGVSVQAASSPYSDLGDLGRLRVMPSLLMILVAIHFILFVLACVATDDNLREYSDVIFISREQTEEDDVSTLPASMWEALRPKKLPMAVAVNQYVRFVPGEDGTVRVAGDFGSAAS